MLTRRVLLLSTAVLAAGSARAEPVLPPLTVYKSATCGCCQGWIDAMAKAGFTPTTQIVDAVAPLWRKRGIPDALASCHLAEVGGYVVLGHVPPEDVKKLLADRPPALGLTVPGMVMGSPGMETPSGRVTPYDTLLLLSEGGSRVFASHGRT